VPLNQIATFEFGQELPLIWRRDRVPTLTVQADTAPGVLPETVVTRWRIALRRWPSACPPAIASIWAAPWRRAPSRAPR
jgi:multidrug efflux pump subunit AcrB